MDDIFTGYIALDGRHIKDGLKTQLKDIPPMVGEEGWSQNISGGYQREVEKAFERVWICSDHHKNWKEKKLYQNWWSQLEPSYFEGK